MSLVAARVVVASLVVAVGVATGRADAETADEGLPVTVGLAGTHVYLRSGPGDDFYPTERLVRGAEVEVWAIDEAGWCAVRPVAGSFSWLRASDIEPAAGAADTTGQRGPHDGVVVTDGAVARVGSQLNDLRHVSQVALEAGERVRVIEQVAVAAGRHTGAWVRIEPPSGEFRWVRGEELALPEGLVVATEPASVAGGFTAAGEAIAAIREAGSAVSRAVAEVDLPPVDAAAPGPPALLPAGNAFTRLVSGWLPRGTNVFDPAPAAAPTAVGAGAVAMPADELADIDLALSLAVTGSSSDWNLAPLRERLRLAAARAASPAERTRAQAIDARLARFEEIQSGQRALAQGAPAAAEPVRIGGMWSSLSALGSRPIRPGVMPGGAPAGGQPTWTPPDQAETTGRLATVISRRPEAPRWALVDDHNNVIVFVTPQPGVNLAPLVGQQVTVRGAKGFMPEYKRPYLVATEARTRLASVPPTASDRIQ